MANKVAPRACDDQIRQKYAKIILDALTAAGEDVAMIDNGAMNAPTVDANGEETYFEVHVKIPKGQRKSKEEGGGFIPYNYIEPRENYLDKVAERQAKIEEKAKKAEKDE